MFRCCSRIFPAPRVVSRFLPLAWLLSALACSLCAFAASSRACPGGTPVNSFRILVEPAGSGSPLALTRINMVQPGQKLKYEPVHGAAVAGPKSKVALVLIPASQDDVSNLRVLDPKPADAVQEWDVPIRASAVGLVLGEHGLDTKKVASLVRDNPALVTQLADYADQSSKVEALVQTLSAYEQSAPGSSDLQSMLHGFSSQYGVALPKLDASAPADQQANTLLRAVVPAFQGDGSNSKPNLAEHSTGLAAAVASMFFGSPVGLAAGGAALLESLHSAIFPGTDFRPAFTQAQAQQDQLTLCSGMPVQKTRKNVEYLWMQRIPDAPPPQVKLADNAVLPLGWTSGVQASTASVAQLKLLSHARDWRLVGNGHETAVPVKVVTGAAHDILTLDLTHAKMASGRYQLAAEWDWTPITAGGAVDVRPLGDFRDAKLEDESADALIAGAGAVSLHLTGADFEFLQSVSLLPARSAAAQGFPADFVLPHPSGSEQPSVQVSVNSAALHPGSYLLRLTQVDGSSHDVPVTVLPPNPQLDHLPLTANVGEASQTVTLRGSGLNRIERITSPGATWELAPADAGMDASSRQVTIKLADSAKPGDAQDASLFVAGLHQPLKVSGALKLLGPRPKILSVTDSLPSQSGVQLLGGEIPAGLAASFSLRVDHLDAQPTLQLNCEPPGYAKQGLTLRSGDRQGTAALDFSGEGALFLSLDPGQVGPPGCTLKALVFTADGSSDPYVLGRVVSLPRIDKLAVSGEKLGESVYAATLTGENLQTIAKTGWNPQTGYDVPGIATPVPGSAQQQTLQIAVPWPPPAPQAPLYIWLRGDTRSRLTNARY